MTEILNILNIIFAVVVVLFLPGFVISYIFFDKNKIDIVERFALSCALSIAVVPLLVFYLNLLGVKITKFNILIEISLIIVESLIIIWIKKLKTNK
ncbi:MAG TPA: DUF1616 domain-containing protein [Candidatus Saccharimonadales bacterium]|nr:DUF1616 domain-containing protein [Candidatus Saccharimonadales bacterium]